MSPRRISVRTAIIDALTLGAAFVLGVLWGHWSGLGLAVLLGALVWGVTRWRSVRAILAPDHPQHARAPVTLGFAILAIALGTSAAFMLGHILFH